MNFLLHLQPFKSVFFLDTVRGFLTLFIAAVHPSYRTHHGSMRNFYLFFLLQTDITLRDTKPNNMWKLGAVVRVYIIASVLMLGAELVSGTLPELECPEDCDCHYFRINWVTDCSESNFTEIPHEGLSQNVYVLNMNSNNVTEVQRFPEDIKLRRLQLADNLLTKLSTESFAGLSYLLDADFSGNRITHVDSDAFRLVAV